MLSRFLFYTFSVIFFACSSNSSTSVELKNVGNAKTELKDYQGAVKEYDAAIDLNPKDPKLFNNRGAAKTELKDYSGAIKDFTQAIELDPSNAKNYSNRGLVQASIKKF